MFNKNIGPFQYFTADWFRQHQRPLLWLLNHPAAKHFTRWIMAIRSHDIGITQPIVHIGPNRFTKDVRILPDGRVQATTVYRTHEKYGKRVYHAGKGLWLLAHWFDMKIANPFQPAWNLGFDDFGPVYPQAGSGGANITCDGWGRVADGTSWASARARTSCDTSDDVSADMRFDGMLSGGTYYLGRLYCSFDTSSLDDAKSLLNATLSLYYAGEGSNAETTNPADLVVVESTQASAKAVVDNDFDNVGSTPFSSAYDLGTLIGSSAYHDISLNAAGLSFINKTGVTKFAIRPANDFSDSTAPSAGSYCKVYAADQSGTTNDPKLVANYATSTYGGMMF